MQRTTRHCIAAVFSVLSLLLVSCPDLAGNDATFELYFVNASKHTTVQVETLELVNQQTGQLENVLDETVGQRRVVKLLLSAEKFATGFATVRFTGQQTPLGAPIPFTEEASGFRVGPGPTGIALVNVGQRGKFEPIVSAFEITDARDAKGANTFNYYLLNITGLSVSEVELKNLQTDDFEPLLLVPMPPFTLLIQPVSTAIHSGQDSETNIIMETGQSVSVGFAQFGPEPEGGVVFDSDESGDITPEADFFIVDNSVE